MLRAGPQSTIELSLETFRKVLTKPRRSRIVPLRIP